MLYSITRHSILFFLTGILFIFPPQIKTVSANDRSVSDTQGSTSVNRVKPLTFHFVPSVFRGDDGKTILHIAFAVPHRELNFQESNFGKGKCPLNIEIAVRDDAGDEINRFTEQIVVWSGAGGGNPFGYFLSDRKISAPPDAGSVMMSITTLDKSKFGLQERALNVPDFARDSLRSSSIQLAYRIDETEPGRSGDDDHPGLQIVPYPFRKVLRSYPLFAYFQIYNLTQDDNKTARYSIEYSVFKEGSSGSFFRKIVNRGKKKPVIGGTLERVSSQFPASDFITFDPDNLDAGQMILMISIRDEISQNVTDMVLPFEIINDPSELLP